MSAECSVCGSHLVQRNTGEDMKFLCPLCEWGKAEASAVRGWAEAEKLAAELPTPEWLRDWADWLQTCSAVGGIDHEGFQNDLRAHADAIAAALAAFEAAKKEAGRA